MELRVDTSCRFRSISMMSFTRNGSHQGKATDGTALPPQNIGSTPSSYIDDTTQQTLWQRTLR